jgi:phosphatidylglycerol lysyltransferase
VRWTHHHLSELLVWLVTLATAGSGLLNIYSVLAGNVPARVHVLEKIFPLEFLHLSRFLTLLIGFTLVISSISIRRRKRRALRLVMYLLLFSVLFHLTTGLDYEEASLSLLLFVILAVTRRYFRVQSGPLDLKQAIVRTAACALIVVCYSVLGLSLMHEREFGVSFNVAEALKHTLLLVSLAVDPQLTPLTAYARWFMDSVYLMTFATIVYAGLAFFNPIIYRFRTSARERLQARRIVHQYGRSSLDFFKLWRDKSYYFNNKQNCFIAYQVANNYALALSDPVGPEEFLEETVSGFMEFCRLNDWGVALYQTLPTFLPMYHRLGLKHLKVGDTAVVDLMTFSLDGSHRRKLREIVNKFERKRFQIVEHEPPLSGAILAEARHVSDDWLSLPGRRERQFSLGMFEESYIRLTPLYTLVDERGSMVAFVNRIESYRKGEATVDLMRHLKNAPNGAMDYLFTKLFLACKREGFERFDMGMVPLDGFGQTEHASLQERTVHSFIRHLNFIFSYSGLQHYKAKFADTWEPRYLLYQNILTLPKVAIALTKVSERHWAR